MSDTRGNRQQRRAMQWRALVASCAAGMAATALVAGAQAATAAQAEAVQAASTPPAQNQLSSLADRQVASVVAPNGDNNPYEIAVVPLTAGILTKGDVLVADFNSAGSAGGGGTTIMQVNPATGAATVFFAGAPVAGPVGIAINPVNDGVWIGDYGAARDGTGANDLLIAATGKLMATFNDTTTSYNPSTGTGASFLGVWGQAVSKVNGAVSFYYGNAGNATTGTGGGDVWRLTPHPTGAANGQPVNSTYAQIATGQPQTPAGGSAATAAGPQGLAYDNATGVLYETNDANNTLYAIPNAASATGPQTASVVYQGSALASPQNVVINPLNGDLLIVNGTVNDLVEITPAGQVVGTLQLAKGQAAGALFGLAASTAPNGSLLLYYTDAADNTLHELSAAPAGYRMVSSDGGIFTFGGAGFYGSLGGAKLNQPIVGIATSPDGRGYTLVAADGGIFTFGDARFYGSLGAVKLNRPIVGIATSPDGRGYTLVAADGGIFSFGDAGFYGSLGGTKLNQPIVGIATTPDGGGYTLVAADGGIFSFGDAGYFASLGGATLNKPIVGIATTANGQGYTLGASDGGVFTFGDAGFYGSLGAVKLNQPIVGLAGQ